VAFSRRNSYNTPRYMKISLVFKGKTETFEFTADATTDAVFAECKTRFGLADQNVKILAKGKQLPTGLPLTGALTSGAKCMVMATGKAVVAEVLSAKSDPTVRSFASEDAAALHHKAEERSEELSEWGVPQDREYKFCRFESCTWQSFGTRPSSSTPHAFDARALLLKLAQDPAIVNIMREREWTVGLLAELDPIDDRLAEKMEGGGKRLLGYNTNAGAEIHMRLRTQDLSGFLPYPAIIDTLLHELAHNEVGPHNEQFWALFCQLKADYLRFLLDLSACGQLFRGKSAVQLAQAAEEVKDVRANVLAALERDRQVPLSAMPQQVAILDAYMASGDAVKRAKGGTATSGHKLGGSGTGADAGTGAGAPLGPLTAAERRELIAAKALERRGPAAAGAPPQAVALRVQKEPSTDEAEPMDVSDASVIEQKDGA